MKLPNKVDAINELEMDFNDVRDWLVRGFDYDTNTLVDESLFFMNVPVSSGPFAAGDITE